MENGMMIIGRKNLRCHLPVILVLAVAIFTIPGFAGAEIAPDSPNTFYTLIDALIKATPQLGRASVERLTGTKLVAITNDKGPFIFYRSQNRKLKDIIVALIDFREPVVGTGALVGPSLALDFKNGCFKFDDINAHYGPLKLKYLTPLQSISYARTELWGEVLFSFPETSPDCLKYVVIKVKSPPQQ